MLPHGSRRQRGGEGGAGGAGGKEKKEVKTFFTLQEFSAWWSLCGVDERRKWRVKYYKGKYC